MEVDRPAMAETNKYQSKAPMQELILPSLAITNANFFPRVHLLYFPAQCPLYQRSRFYLSASRTLVALTTCSF